MNNLFKIKHEFKKQISEKNYYNAVNLIYQEIGFYIIFPIFSYLIGQIVLILVFVTTPIYIKKQMKIKRFDFLSFFILLILIYQIALSVLAYHLPVYLTNIFLLLIILIGINLNNKKTVIEFL